MSDAEQAVATEVEEATSEETPAAAPEPEQTTPSDATDWKAMARKHEKEAKQNREAARELAALKAKEQTDAERLAAERDAEREKVKAAVRRAVTAEVKSVASSLKFCDPSDALRMLDLDEYTDESGEVDEAAIRSALEEIAAKKPYLLASSEAPAPARSGGPVGGGSAVPSQLSREDLKDMSSDQIVKAKEEGRLNQLLGIK